MFVYFCFLVSNHLSIIDSAFDIHRSITKVAFRNILVVDLSSFELIDDERLAFDSYEDESNSTTYPSIQQAARY